MAVLNYGLIKKALRKFKWISLRNEIYVEKDKLCK